jgi:hypothetical protein
MLTISATSYVVLYRQRIQNARLSFQSSELGPPPPHPHGSVPTPPLWVQGGRHTRFRGGGVGGPNSDLGTDNLVLYTITPLQLYITVVFHPALSYLYYDLQTSRTHMEFFMNKYFLPFYRIFVRVVIILILLWMHHLSLCHCCYSAQCHSNCHPPHTAFCFSLSMK